jgi:predicted phage terminase large subunit-like protein
MKSKEEIASEIYVRDSTEDLLKYVHLMWPVLEPGKIFIPGWHIEAICEHLEAVESGQIRNLLINIPPGHMKSLLVCVLYPSWSWIKKPQKRFITASYAQTLSTRDSVKTRDLIRSERYQKLYRPRWALKDDQDQKTRFSNTMTGSRIATSVGGSGTGERADCLIVDDPLNAIDAHSELIRKQSVDWWFQTMSTRDADPKTTSRIVVMQRLHEKDLAGELINRGDYVHLCLPAEFEPKRKCITQIGWEDPRKNEGELLWPEQFGANEIGKAKKDLGSQGYSGQFQQSPVPAEGGLFKRKWWKFYKEKPKNYLRVIQFWDCAEKPGISNDYSVCATWMETQNGFYLLDLWREKVEFPQLQAALRTNYNKWSNFVSAVVIEDKSAGTQLIQYAKQETTLPIIPFDPAGVPKETRAISATPTVEAGNCFLPDGVTFVEDFISEHEKFPKGEHDDTVDTTSMMTKHFSQMQTLQPRIRQL